MNFPSLAPISGRISLVIPVFNEALSLAKLFAEIDAVSLKLKDRNFEVIFVDDGSSDESGKAIDALMKADPRVRGIRFRRNFGKAAALHAGFEQSTGEVVFTLDADLQDDPAEIPRFLDALKDFDLVSGYKQVRHDPWSKVFPSRVFNGLVSFFTGVKLHDHNCGFKAMRADVAREICLYGELHRFVPVLANARGFRVGEIVIAHRPRQFGHSKFGWQRFLKGFLDLLQVTFVTKYGKRPMHFFGTLAVIAFGLGMLSGLVGLLAILLNFHFVLTTLALGSSGVLTLIAAQCLLCGFLAELQTAQACRERKLPVALPNDSGEPGA